MVDVEVNASIQAGRTFWKSKKESRSIKFIVGYLIKLISTIQVLFEAVLNLEQDPL